MSTVTLRENELQLNGKATTLLCASLFYFRIPRENWEERMDQLRMAGYNCIDVYIPWNFHELRPGEWHFEDEHDVSAFLSLAARHGLYVIARPVHLLRVGRRCAAQLAVPAGRGAASE